MAWDLNGSDQYARFTMSANLKAATGGPFTFGAIVNLDATTDGAIIHFLDGTTARHFMEIFGTYNFGTVSAAKAGPAGTGGGTTWVHIIMSKATGSVVPEYTITTIGGSPTSGTCTGGNLGNGAAPGASGQIQIGRFATSATEYVDGKVAGLWAHASYMNQTAREALTSWSGVVTAASASALGWAVHLNTLSTITDATGQGGDETGRFGTTPFTLVSDPSGFFGGGDATATPAATAATTALPAAAVSAGSTRAPAAVAATVALPAPTVSAGSTKTPAVTAAVVAVPAPTVNAGSTKAPAVTAVAVAVPAATVSAGSTLAPAAVQAAATVPAVTVSAGGTATPAAIAATVALPAPVVSAGGNSTVGPASVGAAVTVPSVTVSAGGAASPAPVAATVTVPAATVAISATVTPAAIAFTITMPTPQVSATGGATVTPATIAATVSFAAPTVPTGETPPVPAFAHVTASPVRHVRTGPLVHVSG